MLQNLSNHLWVLDAGDDRERSAALLAPVDLDPKDALQGERSIPGADDRSQFPVGCPKAISPASNRLLLCSTNNCRSVSRCPAPGMDRSLLAKGIRETHCLPD
jgi:hypothetical protein